VATKKSSVDLRLLRPPKSEDFSGGSEFLSFSMSSECEKALRKNATAVCLKMQRETKIAACKFTVTLPSFYPQITANAVQSTGDLG
jgi:hypothetical protein